MDEDEIEKDLKYPFKLDKDISKIRDSLGPFKYKSDKDYGRLWFRSKAYHQLGIYTGQVQIHTFNPHGKGYMIRTNKTLYEGYWENGVQIGKGRIIYPNSSVLEGVFKHGRVEGDGKFRDNKGNVFRGVFKDGKFHGDIQSIKWS